MTARRALAWAVAAQSVLAVYLQVIEWVPLFPWNDLARGNGQERLDVVLAGVSLLLIAGTWRGVRRVVAAAAMAQLAWLWLQVDSWWRPYLFGATARELQFQARWFSRTAKWLPEIEGYPGPDAAHVVLQALIVVALAATARAWYLGRAPLTGAGHATIRALGSDS